MKKVILIGALSLLCGAGANATINIAGVAKQVDTLECRSVGPGVQYVRMHMPEYPLDVYTLTIDLNNPYNDVNAFIGKDHAGTTEAMTQAYTRLSTPGHRPIGSVNGNFWIVSGQGMDDLLGQPHSGCMVNGEFATEPNNWNRGNRGEGIERLQEIAFVMLDEEKNDLSHCRNAETCISKDESPVKIFVIPTDEELVITEDAYALMNGTYDIHTNFHYTFENPDYVNKARARGLKENLKKNPQIERIIALPPEKASCSVKGC